MKQISWRFTDLACRLLEPNEQDVIRGDLAELNATAGQALHEVLGLVFRRQTALWRDSRPWLALCALVIPLGVLLSLLSGRMAGLSAIYGWLYVNNWTADYLAAGFRNDLVHYVAVFSIFYLALICWAWTVGFVIGSFLRRGAGINGIIFFLVLVFGGFVVTSHNHNPVNAAVFSMTFYRLILPLIFLAVLALMPAFTGMRHGVRLITLPQSSRAILWACSSVTILALAAVSARPRWQFWSLPFALIAPLAYILVTARLRKFIGSRLPVITALLALLVLSIQPLAAETHSSPRTGVLAPKAGRKMAPDFTLTDAKGQPITLSAYKGKIVLLDFWATWCGGCKVEVPWYVEFYKKYQNRGLAVIGVSMDDQGMKVVKPFLAQKKIDYPVVIGTEKLAKQYNLTSMPMTLLIDREGRIAVSHTGVVNKDDFESDIKELLQ